MAIPEFLKGYPIFGGGRYGIMSGENPMFKTGIENPTHEKLVRALKDMQLDYDETHGRYGSPERSVIIHNPTRDHVAQLGKMFGQESVVFGQGHRHELLYTNGEHEGKSRLTDPSQEAISHFQDPPEDYYSAVPRIPKGGYFRINFDFNSEPQFQGPVPAGVPMAKAWPKNRAENEQLAQHDSTTGPEQQGDAEKSDLFPHPHQYPWHDGHTSHHENLNKNEEFNEVAPEIFEAAISSHPRQETLDSPREYTGKRTFLSSDRKTGYALKGDELKHVFSLVPGKGEHAVRHAIANGAKRLDTFDGKLVPYYSRFGFKEVSREKNFNPTGPDVIFMAKNEELAPAGTSSDYHRFAGPYGQVTGKPNNLKFYRYENKLPDIEKLVKDHGYQTYYAGGRYGKALALDTPIPTPSGIVTLESLKVGDVVFGPDGFPTTIIAKSEVHRRPSFKVSFSDRSDVVAADNHLWSTFTNAQRRKDRISPKQPQIFTTLELKETLVCRGEKNHSIPTAKPLQFNRKDLPIDPYLLGVWLGDGSRDSGRIYGIDEQIFEEIRNLGYHTSPIEQGVYVKGLKPQLKAAGLLNNKHVPSDALYGDFEQRVSLLQGLMDTDGFVSKRGQCVFYNTNIKLVEAVEWLLASLGLQSKRFDKPSQNPAHKDCFCVSFFASQDLRPFRLERKVARCLVKKKPNHRFIVSVEPIGGVAVQCIQVARPDGLFLVTRSCVTTHNSDLAKKNYNTGHLMILSDEEGV